MGAGGTATIERLAHDVVEIRDPETALRALTALRRELESIEPALVQRTLHAGASWSHVARALGVTKQAAHRKYRHLADRALGDAAGQDKVMVTSEARLSVHLAREEAKRLGQPAVGTEHLLLGILRCKRSPAARALGALGITHRAASAQLHPTLTGLPRGGQRLEAAGGRHGDGLTDQARRIVEGSLREALNRGDDHIGAEHLLLALLADSRNGAVQTLEALHAPPSKIRAQLERDWKAGSEAATAGAPMTPPPQPHPVPVPEAR